MFGLTLCHCFQPSPKRILPSYIYPLVRSLLHSELSSVERSPARCRADRARVGKTRASLSLFLSLSPRARARFFSRRRRLSVEPATCVMLVVFSSQFSLSGAAVASSSESTYFAHACFWSATAKEELQLIEKKTSVSFG